MLKRVQHDGNDIQHDGVGSEKSSEKKTISSEKKAISSEKTSDKILALLKENPEYSAVNLAEILGISSRAVEKHISADNSAQYEFSLSSMVRCL